MFGYSQSTTNMLPSGEHEGVITKVSIYNNPNGNDKLIVEISLEDETLFSHFFTPGFAVFEELIRVAGETPKQKGEFDEQSLVDKMVKFTTEITISKKTGSEYCNVTAIKLIADEAEEAPFPEEETTPAPKKKAIK